MYNTKCRCGLGRATIRFFDIMIQACKILDKLNVEECFWSKFYFLVKKKSSSAFCELSFEVEEIEDAISIEQLANEFWIMIQKTKPFCNVLVSRASS